MGQVIDDRRARVVGQGQRVREAEACLPLHKFSRRDACGVQDRLVDLEHTRTLPVDLVEEAQTEITLPGAGTAVFWSSPRTASACDDVGDVQPFACRNSAAAPATCGEDIDVPLIVA